MKMLNIFLLYYFLRIAHRETIQDEDNIIVIIICSHVQCENTIIVR